MRTIRRFTTPVLAFCAAAGIAIVLCATVARAQCSDVVIGSGYSCTLTGEDRNYCYYDCECHGISQSQCDSRLAAAGFERIS